MALRHLMIAGAFAAGLAVPAAAIAATGQTTGDVSLRADINKLDRPVDQ